MRGVIFTEVLDKLASMVIGALVTYVITEIRARKKMNEAHCYTKDSGGRPIKLSVGGRKWANR